MADPDFSAVNGSGIDYAPAPTLRLQVMYLPAPEGEYPFLLVVDSYGQDPPSPEVAEHLKTVSGARGVIAYHGRIEIV